MFHHKAHSPGTELFPMQLGPGLPDGPPPYDEGRQHYLLLMGAPQGYVLSPLQYSMYTHDCMASHSSNSLIKSADDTTVVGLITNNDEMAYREEVGTDGVVPGKKPLNVSKTKEPIVDFRRKPAGHAPHPHQWGRCEDCQKLQVPQCPHLQRAEMVKPH